MYLLRNYCSLFIRRQIRYLVTTETQQQQLLENFCMSNLR